MPSKMILEPLRFLSADQCRDVRKQFGTPVYVYDEASLRASASACLAFPNAFGLTVRYAMKAAPNAAILKLFHSMGLHIDASSGFEVERAMHAGIPGDHISLSAQELPENLRGFLQRGVLVNATSLNQLRTIGKNHKGGAVGLRFNPGLGSGGTKRTNVGGPASSFGIWHEYADQAAEIAAEFDLTVERIHTHIGSGSDPAVWQRVAGMSLDLVRRFPDAHTLDLGGGFKVGRMADEQTTDLQVVGAPVKAFFESFAEDTGRQIKLEIEPGTFLVANAASILSTVQDIVDTGSEGYTFLRLNTGMTEVLRPSLYGAQHPIVIVPSDGDNGPQTTPYMVCGHCCESGDILTPSPGDPEGLAPRTLPTTTIGDICVIEGAGAYCAGMSAKNYNSFPEAAEVMLLQNGRFQLVRERQTLGQIIANEK